MNSDGTGFDLIFISLEDWDQIWRRNQFVCAELARRFQEMKILFVGLARNVSNDLRRGRLARIWRSGMYHPEGLANITITHPLKLLPDSIGLGRLVNECMFRWHVRAASRSLGLKKPVLWVNPHNAAHVAGRLGESVLIYDITDDWTSFQQAGPVMARTRRQDAELARKADAVIVCSAKLYAMKKGIARRLQLIENGVHSDHYADVLNDGPVPAEAATWDKPVFGYTGTLHPERVDVGLVEAVATRLSRGSMVFVGPNDLTKADQARLLATGKVHLIGPVAYSDLPKYMRAIDVCIVPHRMTAFTESLNPIKLWEYLAVGKPIVSTDVAGFRDYRDLVRIASTAQEFLTAMSQAEAEGVENAAVRRAVAHRNSWGQRVDDIINVVEECIKCTANPAVAVAPQKG